MNKLRGMTRVTAQLVVSSMVVFLALAAPCFGDMYDINFTASSGPTPTGSFSYTDGSGFSDLIVTVQGAQFDFTTLFNTNFLDGATGPFCGTLSQSEVAFEYLNGQTNCLGSADGSYGVEGNTFQFVSRYVIPNGPVAGAFANPLGGAASGTAVGNGSFTITDLTTSAVPEPSSLTTAAMLTLLLGLALALKRRRTKDLVN
jgi:hypothetical protein